MLKFQNTSSTYRLGLDEPFCPKHYAELEKECSNENVTILRLSFTCGCSVKIYHNPEYKSYSVTTERS